ncbi:hypothetical protein BDA96_10G203800 [Sorghum bicolor]|uniref:Uncharacterized protein n=2 Tax=Sorghum bicolor TaxID=4558 RepID=A0A921U1K3_SORBI|nr:hypothetical protein BDA96_10G203800 [Sorghum bicolor]OQU76501.1 hypothetical protein SORBI_3010G155701 [Sorghum bicolor]
MLRADTPIVPSVPLRLLSSHPTRPRQRTWWCRQVKNAHRSCVLF